MRAPAAPAERAGLAERDDDRARAARDERVGGGLRAGRRSRRHPAEPRGLAGVGRQVVDEVQPIDGRTGHRRRVEDRRRAASSRERERGRDALERHLARRHHDLGPLEIAAARLHLRHRQRAVGPGRDADLIASRPVHQDQRGAGGRRRRRRHARHADALLGQRSAHLPARRIVADATDQPHLGAEPARRHRLVGALATARDEQRALGDGLAGLGQPLQGDREVDVGRAHD